MDIDFKTLFFEDDVILLKKISKEIMEVYERNMPELSDSIFHITIKHLLPLCFFISNFIDQISTNKEDKLRLKNLIMYIINKTVLLNCFEKSVSMDSFLNKINKEECFKS